MIRQLNVNHKVVVVAIRLDINNPNSKQSLINIINRYDNLDYIQIYDRLDQIDSEMHDLLKMIINKSTLLCFKLVFDKSMNNERLSLFKEYNELIRTK